MKYFRKKLTTIIIICILATKLCNINYVIDLFDNTDYYSIQVFSNDSTFVDLE